MTSCTRSLSHSFPLLRSSGLWPMRPSSAIRSRRPRVSTAVSAVTCGSGAGWVSAAISVLLILGYGDARFGARLAKQFLILNHLLQQALQFFISDQAATDVCQAVS